MAKREKIQKMTKDEIPSSEPLGDVEQQDLATASATAQPDAEKRMVLTPEAKRLWDGNNLGIQTAGLYGPRESRPLGWHDLEDRSNFLDRPLTVEDIAELHSEDPSAPTDEVVCGFCQKTIGQPIVRTALVKNEVKREGDVVGDLVCDRDGNVVYRGQAVVVGRPMAVQPGHVGNCLFKLRDAREKTRQLADRRTVRDLLPSQAFDQAQARLEGVTATFAARKEQNSSFRDRIGFGGKGDGFNSPHRRATAGRQSRDPRERNIGNRG